MQTENGSVSYKFLSDIIADLGTDWRPYLSHRRLVKNRIVAEIESSGVRIAMLPRRRGFGMAVAASNVPLATRIIKRVIDSDDASRAMLMEQRLGRAERANRSAMAPELPLEVQAALEIDVEPEQVVAVDPEVEPDPVVAVEPDVEPEQVVVADPPAKQEDFQTLVAAVSDIADAINRLLAMSAAASNNILFLATEVAELKALWVPEDNSKDE